ncbi:MAG: phosphatase PAP2 family protein [Actinomycetota bacterium]|nr:phosphatase PAP2 family protein [Actinomycetota bacterium]
MDDGTRRGRPDPDDATGRNTEYLGSRDLTSWQSRWGRALADRTLTAAVRVHRYLDKRGVPYVVLLVTVVAGVVVAGLLTALSAQIYDSVTDRDGVAGLDRPILNQMIAWRSPGLNDAVTAYTDLGSTAVMPFVAVVAAGLLSWWWRTWTPALLMAIAAGGSLAMTVLGKQSIDRARPVRSLAVPPFESSPSFPSGHTLNTWVILLLIAYLVCLRLNGWWPRVATIVTAVLLGLAMAASRVYLGHHWLTDVLVGMTLGSAWLIVVITGHRLGLTVRRRQSS